VRDTQGKPAVDALVELRSNDSLSRQIAHTNAQGIYQLAGLHEGVYALQVTKTGYAGARINSLFLRSNEEKNVDLVIGSPSKESVLGKPTFSDERQFTVSGITDVSNLGGHGSDTVVRTREALAEKTVSLGKESSDSSAASSAADRKSLQASAERIRSQLPQRDQAELHHELGEIEEKLGDPLESVRQYQRAADMDPSESNFFDWGAEVLLHHAPEPALEIFSKGNTLFPRSERMLLALGATWFAGGRYEEAIQRICQASDLNPSDPTPYIFLGRIALAETRPSPEALEKLQRFVTLQPRSPEANYYYAVALWKQAKRARDTSSEPQAESLLHQALALDPKFAAASLQLGIIHSDQGKYSEAASNYSQAIELDPKMEEAHYRLAQAYRQLGQTEQAKDELRVYEQLSKESEQQEERKRHEIRQLVYTLRTVDH
jgi:tetratricopeptide (TPR) repeat protein